MKKTIVLLLTGFVISLTGCKNNPCNGIVTYQKIDTRLTGYVFKPGSYWVYLDSVDGIRDSQYVYSSSYRIHYRDPIDTPTLFYQRVSPGGAVGNLYCGPFYTDSLWMSYVSYQNGIIKDTLNLFTYTPLFTSNGERLLLWENLFPKALPYIGAFQLKTPDSIGLVYSEYNDLEMPLADTIRFWYQGVQPSLATPVSTFNNVTVFGVQFIDQNSTRFKYPTDLYFASGSGIVKIVQHKPTGDIPWTLINYHISN